MHTMPCGSLQAAGLSFGGKPATLPAVALCMQSLLVPSPICGPPQSLPCVTLLAACFSTLPNGCWTRCPPCSPSPSFATSSMPSQLPSPPQCTQAREPGNLAVVRAATALGPVASRSPACLCCPTAGVRVESVQRTAGGVSVTDASGRSTGFDEIVFACGAEEALRMLGSDASR